MVYAKTCLLFLSLYLAWSEEASTLSEGSFNGTSEFNGTAHFNGTGQFNGTAPFNGTALFNGTSQFNETLQSNGTSNGRTPNNRIVGGQVVIHRSQFAFQVSLRNNGWPSCGASIIDNRHILTAAHCVTNDRGNLMPISRFAAVFGDLRTDIATPSRVVRQITHMFVHESYNPNTIASDIAVLRVDSLIFNVNINAISLASQLPPPNTNCTISGWGLTSDEGLPSPALLFAHIKFFPQETCRQIYQQYLRPGMFCAAYYGRDSCNGDSGGPMVCNGVQVGIVSWGVRCADPNFPGVYASVPHYLPWIRRQQERSASNSIISYKYLLFVNALVYFLYTHVVCK